MDVGKSKMVKLETTEVTCSTKTQANLGHLVFEGFLRMDKTMQKISVKLSIGGPHGIFERREP